MVVHGNSNSCAINPSVSIDIIISLNHISFDLTSPSVLQIVSNMQPLLTVKRILIWLCMTPPEKSTSEWEKKQYLVFAFIVISSFLFMLMAHVAYIVEFLRTDLAGSLFAFLGVCGFW